MVPVGYRNTRSLQSLSNVTEKLFISREEVFLLNVKINCKALKRLLLQRSWQLGCNETLARDPRCIFRPSLPTNPPIRGLGRPHRLSSVAFVYYSATPRQTLPIVMRDALTHNGFLSVGLPLSGAVQSRPKLPTMEARPQCNRSSSIFQRCCFCTIHTICSSGCGVKAVSDNLNLLSSETLLFKRFLFVKIENATWEW